VEKKPPLVSVASSNLKVLQGFRVIIGGLAILGKILFDLPGSTWEIEAGSSDYDIQGE